MAAGDTLIDTLFDSRYQIARKLGSGGMANVYLAYDQELGRRVAIKILDDRHASDEQFIERFRREAQNAAGLSHPNIVSIYDRGEAEGTYYIAMEHIEGRTLKELLVARGPSPLGIAIDYSRQILSALRFAHRNGIVHRDIKPHNVIVDGDGRVKVMDFGIARAGAASQMTEAGSIIGTAQYLSPEQARGAPVDQTSDLYSTGIVLYELLTGTVPFTGDTPVEIAMKHLSQTPVPPSALRPEIPRDLDYVVLRALAKDPADRYHSAEEMDSDLERIARGIGVSAETAEAATTVLSRGEVGEAATTAGAAATTGTTYTPGRYYEYDEAPRSRSIWPWLLALLLLVGALTGGWFAWQELQDQLSAAEPVAVPDVEGVAEQLAVDDIREAGLKELVQREPNADTQEGIVFEQDPQPGERIERGNFVTIIVSSGPPKTRVPNVVGQSRDAAVATLVDAGLEPNVVQVNSLEPVNTVTGIDPKAGTELIEGSTVRVNVSKGPKPVTVPNVIGSAFESAESQLQGVGFAVARQDVDDPEPAGIVVGQNPAAGSQQPKGSVITLQVSRGPQTSQVPDVTSQTEAEASAQLETSGFQVQVVEEIVEDESLDGRVLSQDPEGGTEAEQGTTIVIVVGRFEAPPAEETPPPTQPTTTEPTITQPQQP
jgi:eukaryotic-like serine/threonine-protein kinase